jgi:hypothetical protein
LSPNRAFIRLAAWGVFGVLCGSLQIASAQTTQGLISGSVINSVTGRPVGNASVTYSSTTLAASGTLQSDDQGYYFLPLLSAGTYTIRTTADGYQSQQLEELELPVAGRIQIDFKLRPLSDVWEAGQFRSVFLPGSKTIVTFYGPDVDTSRSGSFEGQSGKRGTLDTSVSYVIDPEQISDLPLNGRDVYTMLVSLPGVTANNGTARGLGISVTGARPSSSNFLLDGVENNNYLVTGPLNPVAPEAIQEYRISTNNYSAEYGRTGGFIANAVTRAGGAGYHGIAYEYLKNDVLNASDFADNLNGIARRPLKQNQFGFQAGGPILKDRLFFSSALEEFFSHSKLDPATYTLPTTNFIPALNIPSSRQAYQLLTEFAPPTIVSPTGSITAKYTTAQPVVVDRLIALERGDYVFNDGRDHLMGRLNIARTSEPDFVWYVYPQFTSGLNQNTTGAATNWMHTFTPRLTSEFKLGYSDDNLGWGRAHPEVPLLSSGDGVLLPGSPEDYDYRNHNRSFEAIYSTIWTRNRHVISAGAGFLKRHNSGYFTILQDGQYGFQNVVNFAFDQPSIVYLPLNTLTATTAPAVPDSNRSYDYSQYYLFAQDSFHVSSRLTLNYGLRYENFGSPENTGSVKDTVVQLGAGGDFTTRLQNATLQLGTGNQKIYGADNLDFAPRAGFTWDVFGKGKTLLRGSFGMFYDRPFDNLWQNVRLNSLLSTTYDISGTFNYLRPIPEVIPTLTGTPQFNSILNILMDPGLRNGYAETAFVGVQQSLLDNLTVEVNATASRGRRLLTSDIVNRQFTTTDYFTAGRPNGDLPDVEWRSSQGSSDYSALSAMVRYRIRTLTLQGSYTWSHSIDNQSDPLGAEVANLGASAVGGSSESAVRSAFAQQYNSNGDRGSSDFDQRHNVFLLGIWQSDRRSMLARGWQVSWMAAFRTGFPYTVGAPQTDVVYGVAAVEDQRANVVNPSAVYFANPTPGPGGKYLINPAAFSIPSDGLLGNSGRNALRGPGLYNVDLSLARSFAVPRIWKIKPPETTRLTFRADAFNVLNHANLNNPDNVLGDPNFGLATYGRQGTASGFPSISPVNETSRQFQLMVRLEF